MPLPADKSRALEPNFSVPSTFTGLHVFVGVAHVPSPLKNYNLLAIRGLVTNPTEPSADVVAPTKVSIVVITLFPFIVNYLVLGLNFKYVLKLTVVILPSSESFPFNIIA